MTIESTSNLVERIAQNDPELVAVHFTDVPDEYSRKLTDLIDAFSNNTQLVTVKMTDDFFACCRQREDVLKAISKLPNLQEFHVADSLIQVLALADLVKHAKKLKSLTMDRVLLQGIQPDFNTFERTLYSHQALKEFDMGKYDVALGEEIVMVGIKTLNDEQLVEASLKDYRQHKPSAFAA